MIHTRNLTVSGGSLLLPFTKQQHDFFYGHSEKRMLLPKGRRVGATSSAAAYIMSCLVSQASVLWVDVTQEKIDEYFNKYFLPLLKQIKLEFWSYDKKYQRLRIVNTECKFGSAQKPESLEGAAYHVIVLNEAGIILKGQKGRGLWYNTLLPMTLDYRAKVFLIGTPKGKKSKKGEQAPDKTSLYYELCCKAGVGKHEKKNNYYYKNLSSYKNPLLSARDIKELEQDVPRLTREQELGGKFIDINDEPIFKEKWFPIVYELPPKHIWKRVFVSMDTAFKKGSENDDSAGVAIVETPGGIFIVDCFAKKLEFPDLLKETEDFYIKNNADFGLIEDAASGQSLIQMYRRNVTFNLLPVPVDRDKVSRAVAVTPICESGIVFLLHGAWNNDFVFELCAFNACLDTEDNRVDAFTQALNYLKINKYPTAEPVSRKIIRTSKVLKGY
jgi:predicted phage terminase large subunit-like protein